MTKHSILGILAAFIWISLNEFIRNQLLLMPKWVRHYQSLGLEFPAAPENGALWGLWSLVFAGVIYVLLQKFSLRQTAALSWVAGFVMMWIVIGNMGVLPFDVLPYAIPWSMLECFGAAWIIEKIGSKP